MRERLSVRTYLRYTLTNGALTGSTLANNTSGGTPYTVTDGTHSVTPSAVGLRNISGRVNGDGTVTIFAVTSTISSLVDVGADPNQLVEVTDNLAFTSAAQAAGEVLTVIKTAQYAEVLRGIAFIPGRVSVSRGGFTFDRRAGKFVQQMTLTNDSSSVITGPVYLVLDNLSSNATLAGAGGTTTNTSPTGSPYVVAVANAATLQPGSSLPVVLQFSNPSRVAITYSERVITGVALP